MFLACLGCLVVLLILLLILLWLLRWQLLKAWALFDLKNALHRGWQDFLEDLASLISWGGKVGAVSVAGWALLDLADILRLQRRLGRGKSTAEDNARMLVDISEVFLKLLFSVGLWTGNVPFIAAGFGGIILFEIYKARILHTNPITNYRDLLLDIHDWLRIFRRVP